MDNKLNLFEFTDLPYNKIIAILEIEAQSRKMIGLQNHCSLSIGGKN